MSIDVPDTSIGIKQDPIDQLSWFPWIQGVAAFPAFYAFHTRLELYALESSMQVFPNNLQIDTPQNTTVQK